MVRKLMLAYPLTFLAAAAANAQPPTTRADITPHRVSGNQVSVSVSMGFFVPGAVAGSDASFPAQERVRRKMYGSAARECDVLRATVASACRRESININVNPTYGYGTQAREGFNISENFAYRVT